MRDSEQIGASGSGLAQKSWGCKGRGQWETPGGRGVCHQEARRHLSGRSYRGGSSEGEQGLALEGRTGQYEVSRRPL